MVAVGPSVDCAVRGGPVSAEVLLSTERLCAPLAPFYM